MLLNVQEKNRIFRPITIVSCDFCQNSANVSQHFIWCCVKVLPIAASIDAEELKSQQPQEDIRLKPPKVKCYIGASVILAYQSIAMIGSVSICTIFGLVTGKGLFYLKEATNWRNILSTLNQ